MHKNVVHLAQAVEHAAMRARNAGSDSCGARPHALSDWRLKPAPSTARPKCLANGAWGGASTSFEAGDGVTDICHIVRGAGDSNAGIRLCFLFVVRVQDMSVVPALPRQRCSLELRHHDCRGLCATTCGFTQTGVWQWSVGKQRMSCKLCGWLSLTKLVVCKGPAA